MIVYQITTNFYSQLFKPFQFFTILTWLLAAVAWVHHVQYVHASGCQDFYRIDSAGDHSPYAVGKRTIKITDKGIEASVFYPVDKSDSLTNDASWFENPE